MRTFVIVPPEPVLTWDEARGHVRLEADDERQDYIMALAAAATGHIDGPGGWVGRAIGVQTLEARFDDFAGGTIALPCPPLISVLSVKYIDASGSEQTVDPGSYELFGNVLAPAYSASWPTPRYQREAVRIQYRAGYPATDADPPVTTVPIEIRVAIGLMVRSMFDGLSVQEALEGAPEQLLNGLRVYS